METTDFAKHQTSFLTVYLTGERNVSKSTICSYRDTFVQLVRFMKNRKEVDAQSLTLSLLTKDVIVEFLAWIQEERKCCMATLTLDGIKLILEQIDTGNVNGRRNLAMLSLMYDSGARVQEIIDLTPSSIRLESPCIIRLVGKGRKARIVPLQEEQVLILKAYMKGHFLFEPQFNRHPLFFNVWRNKLTRQGISYILNAYADMARKVNPALIPSISCHSLRHSKSMHLLQAGVNLVYIRDLLGHVSIQTTEVYARADSKQKREALEKAYVDITPCDEKIKSWEKDSNLLNWLKT